MDTLANLPERKRFEEFWREFALGDGGNMLDEFDIHQQALIAGFAKRVWRAALTQPCVVKGAGKR